MHMIRRRVKAVVDTERHHGDDQSQVTPLVASMREEWNTTHYALDLVLRLAIACHCYNMIIML